jgi:hypothetical protein
MIQFAVSCLRAISKWSLMFYAKDLF